MQVVSCPDKQRSLGPFMSLDLGFTTLAVILVSDFVVLFVCLICFML